MPVTTIQTRGSQALRALVLMGLGLGLTWAAGQWSGGAPSLLGPAAGPSATTSALVQESGGMPAAGGGEAVPEVNDAEAGDPGAGTAGAGGNGPATPVEDVSAEEIEAEIRELERAVSEATEGRAARDPGEIVADKPLSADTAISLPSDI
jgi:hypothetical protein